MASRRTSVDRRSGVRVHGMDTLHLLSHDLYVASIPKDSLSEHTHSLLQLLLRLFSGSPESRRNHFFSFTETASDYSIVLDANLLQILRLAKPGDSIEVAKSKWRPLVVEVGALGSLTGITKIVASVISPLADHNVSVFCLSTNQDDYVMVREEDLQKALLCLSKRFRLVCDSDRKADLSLIDTIEKKLEGTIESPVRLSAHLPCSESPRPITHPYICSSNTFYICSIEPKALASVGVVLLDLMLYSKRSSSDEVFFSLSLIDDDISMVVDTRDINRFPEDSLYFTEGVWRMIKIGEGPLGFDECGIVAQVSAPLAQAEISTYYLCTYYTDRTLVPEGSVGKALDVLNERLVAKVCGQNGFRTPCDSFVDLGPRLLTGAQS